jgi:LCP family protein required for cell wall assembly
LGFRLGDTQPRRRSTAGETRPGAAAAPRLTPRVSTRTAVLTALFLAAGVISGGVAHVVTRDLVASWTGLGLNPFRPQDQVPAGSTAGPGATPTLNLAVTPQPWAGSERVTILVMGLDYRDWVAGEGSPRTDSMMLVTFDPLTRQAGMLSIPRDLWVEIPGFGHNRINTAYMFGEASRLPGGGPGLAMQTVEDLIGVPIQYFAVIDFSTFERMIDEIGGIDVLVTERIKISPIGRTSYWLDPNAHHLDGAQALAYARVRKGAGDDFGRAERQQQVALAILDRVVGFEMIPTLVARAPALYQELSSGIRTNMTLEQMVSIGWSALQIPHSSIHKGVIGPPNMVGFHTLPDGANVLRAVPDQIRILRDRIFTNTGGLGPSIDGITGGGGP